MSKGGSTQSTVTQNALPEYARPYFEDLMGRAESESTRPYSPYPNQRIADVTQATTDARAGITGMNENPLYGTASDTLGDAAATAGAVGNMQGQDFTRHNFGSISDFRNPNAGVSSFMSPYMQNVVDVQKAQAELDFGRAQSSRDAHAVQAGAFGGSRDAVQNALAQEALQRQLGEIQATGSQSAFDAATGAFTNQRDAVMRRQSEQAAETARLQGARADEAYRYGQLGLGVAGLQGDIAGRMAGIAGQQQGDALQLYAAQDAVGAAERAEQQAGLDIGYEDFINQRDYGRDQLAFYSSLLRGIPVTPSTETQRIVQTNPLQQVLGAGLAGIGTWNAYS